MSEQKKVVEIFIKMDIIDKKRYYGLCYRYEGDTAYNVGCSSYDFNTIVEYIKEHFEIVE